MRLCSSQFAFHVQEDIRRAEHAIERLRAEAARPTDARDAPALDVGEDVVAERNRVLDALIEEAKAEVYPGGVGEEEDDDEEEEEENDDDEGASWEQEEHWGVHGGDFRGGDRHPVAPAPGMPQSAHSQSSDQLSEVLRLALERVSVVSDDSQVGIQETEPFVESQTGSDEDSDEDSDESIAPPPPPPLPDALATAAIESTGPQEAPQAWEGMVGTDPVACTCYGPPACKPLM